MIELRDLRPGDKDMIREWRNSLEVANHMFTDRQITQKEHNKWFKQILSDTSSRHWVVVYNSEDIGLLSIDRIDLQNSRCFWNMYIRKAEHRGKGIGNYCEYAVLRYVFDELGLNKICGEVLSSNEIQWGFAFRNEGLLRQHVKKGGQFVDVCLISMLQEEWEVKKSSIKNRLRLKGLL